MSVAASKKYVDMPNAIQLPIPDSKKLYGIDPTIIAADDMTNDFAWYRLAKKHDAFLQGRDFKDRDLFTKYFLLSLGLLEHAVVLIGGEPRSGKSLFMAWFTYQLMRLFGKRATLDWAPPGPSYFGNYFSLYDEDFQEKIIDEFNRLSRQEKETGRLSSPEELTKLILHNTAFGLDECDAWGDRQTQTNLTKLIAMILRRRGHVHTCASLVMIDTNRFAPMILSLATHKVNCIWEGHYENMSSILIQDDRKGGTGRAKWLWLRPKDWVHLWHSHSVSAMTHDVNITYGNKPKKKVKEEVY